MDLLSFAYIQEIPSFYLADNRRLQAQIHYTTSQAAHDRKENSSDKRYNPTPPIELVTKHSWTKERNTFRIKDQKFIYFFSEGWPIDQIPKYLREEDIVPSGMFTQNMARSNLEQALTKLRAEEATYSLINISHPDLPEVKIPIDSLEKLEEALYGCNLHAREIVGTIEIHFNKPLLRVHRYGGKPQRLNSRTKHWEEYTDEKYKPEIGRMLQEDLALLVSA